jgi:DNA-binding transcriptional ArsR family regulator
MSAAPAETRRRASARRADARAAMREARAAASIFAALGDGTRLGIVGRLATGGLLSIAALTEGTGVTRQAVSKHLRVLDEAGLVRSRWQGRERLWEFEPAQVERARRSLEMISGQWNEALGRLKQFVESP